MYVSVYTLVHKLRKTLPKCSPPVYTTQHHPTSMVKPCHCTFVYEVIKPCERYTLV